MVLRPIAHLVCDLMANERKDTLAMAIDVRLAELWAELFELRPEHLDMELLGWFLRADIYTRQGRREQVQGALTRARAFAAEVERGKSS